MHELKVRIMFKWDEGDENKEFMILVPQNVSEEEVTEKLEEAHNHLSFDDDTDYYGLNGRTPEALVEYVCGQNNWEYSVMEYDVDLEFD